MLVDRQAIERLPPGEKKRALALLGELEGALKANPLLGYKPHAKQRQFHASTEPLKAFLGGNRSGKTTAGILDDIIQAVDPVVVPEHLKPYKRFEPPFHCRIICPGEDLLFGVVHQKLREWCPKDQLVGDRFDKAYEKSRGILHFKNGSFFDFLTYGQDLDKFGGTAKHRIHYDEEPPEDIYKEGKMRLMDYKGADTILTMTPQHGIGWMFDAIWEPWQKGTLKRGEVFVVDMDENPYLSQLEKEIAIEGYSKEELESRKKGRFAHWHGMIYPEFDRNVHVIPEIEEVPPGLDLYDGIDPGMRHMAAVVFTYLTPDDTMVVYDELALQGCTVKQVAEEIKKRRMRWGQEAENGNRAPLVPNWTVIDPSAKNVMHQSGRSDQEEYRAAGVVTILGQNSVTAGINRVKERLQAHKLLVTANCTETISQFRKYRWQTPIRSENDPKEAPVKKDDHLLDALRYVIASKPYASPQEQQRRHMTQLERAMDEDLNPSKRTSIPRTPMGGVYA